MEKPLLKFEFNVVNATTRECLSKPIVYADSYIDAVNYVQRWATPSTDVQLSSSGYNE